MHFKVRVVAIELDIHQQLRIHYYALHGYLVLLTLILSPHPRTR